MQPSFATWLQEQNYSLSVRRGTLSSLKAMADRYNDTGELVPDKRLECARRYATFVAAVGAETPFDEAVLATATALQRKQRIADHQGRKNPSVSFPDQDWFVLQTALEPLDTPESHVLRALCLTGYRIGDVLGIERTALRSALKTGILTVTVKGGYVNKLPVEGSRDTWQAIYDAWPTEHVLLANWVCPKSQHGALGGMGAYQRVNRCLKALAIEHGIDSRVHLHRTRRTVGVRALKATKDIHLVGQLLGHRSVAATETYLDELRVDEISELQQRLQKR